MARSRVGVVDLAGQREDKAEGVLGYGVLAIRGNVTDDHAPLSTRLQVDVVVSGRAGGDEAQGWKSREDGAIQT
jgi:hypothetical protein